MVKIGTKTYIIGLITAVVVGIISWAFFFIINSGAGDLLLIFGITNQYYQSGIVIIVGIVILACVGFSAVKIINGIIIIFYTKITFTLPVIAIHKQIWFVSTVD